MNGDAFCRVFARREDAPPPAPGDVERYFVEGDKSLRGELGAWAAWVEIAVSDQPEHWMQHLISTRQLVVLTLASEMAEVHRWAQETCRALEGIYQIDGAGLFDADGKRLAEDAA